MKYNAILDKRLIANLGRITSLVCFARDYLVITKINTKRLIACGREISSKPNAEPSRTNNFCTLGGLKKNSACGIVLAVHGYLRAGTGWASTTLSTAARGFGLGLLVRGRYLPPVSSTYSTIWPPTPDPTDYPQNSRWNPVELGEMVMRRKQRDGGRERTGRGHLPC